MDLPNCVECGHNKEVRIVEGLADNEWYVLYRVCCSACGGDWLWTYNIPETEEEVDAYLRAHGYDPEQLVADIREKIKPHLEAAEKRLRGK